MVSGGEVEQGGEIQQEKHQREATGPSGLVVVSASCRTCLAFRLVWGILHLIYSALKGEKPLVMAENSFREIYNLNNRMQSTHCSWICTFMNPNPNETNEMIP